MAGGGTCTSPRPSPWFGIMKQYLADGGSVIGKLYGAQWVWYAQNRLFSHPGGLERGITVAFDQERILGTEFGCIERSEMAGWWIGNAFAR